MAFRTSLCLKYKSWTRTCNLKCIFAYRWFCKTFWSIGKLKDVKIVHEESNNNNEKESYCMKIHTYKYLTFIK
jgi:hypothetical protein